MISNIVQFFHLQQLQASRDSLLKKADEVERKLRECETEKNRVGKELKDLKQSSNKANKTLKDLRLDVNVMLRNILNEVFFIIPINMYSCFLFFDHFVLILKQIGVKDNVRI